MVLRVHHLEKVRLKSAAVLRAQLDGAKRSISRMAFQPSSVFIAKRRRMSDWFQQALDKNSRTGSIHGRVSSIVPFAITIHQQSESRRRKKLMRKPGTWANHAGISRRVC